MKEDLPDRAEAAYRAGANCAQALLAAAAPELGLDSEAAVRLAAPFGSGMAGLGGPCGTVTSALMVIGLARAETEPNAPKGQVYGLSKRFAAEFIRRHGSIECKELLASPGEPRGKERCAGFVRDSAIILKDILDS